MRAIIIDDEKNGADVLRLLLEQNCEEVNVVAVEHSAESGIEKINELKPDLVFLDIEMPTATGFDVYEATKQLNYAIIFTTAYEQYAIRAFKTQAVDYLLKPIDIDELILAVSNAKRRLGGKLMGDAKIEIDSMMNQLDLPSKKIAISTNEGVMLCSPNDILRLESDSNYTRIYFKDGKMVLVSKTLKSFEEQLKGTNFCRVHNTHLVNLSEIERYIKGDGGTVILKNHTSIPVSRANKQELIEKLGL